MHCMCHVCVCAVVQLNTHTQGAGKGALMFSARSLCGRAGGVYASILLLFIYTRALSLHKPRRTHGLFLSSHRCTRSSKPREPSATCYLLHLILVARSLLLCLV
jgi:hypothetical protein